MAAEAMFMNGGLRVLEGKNKTLVGFVWIEPNSEGDGQIQRWVLTGLLTADKHTSLIVEAWPQAPANLSAWNTAVRKIVDPTQWGTNPEVDGLWPDRKGVYYVVAQSRSAVPTLVRDMNGDYKRILPEPIYPRREAVTAHGLAQQKKPPRIKGKTTIEATPRKQTGPIHGLSILVNGPGGIPQTTVPFFEMFQGLPTANPDSWVKRGEGGGFAANAEGQQYFEGNELFLLYDTFKKTGVSTSMRWQEVAHDKVKSLADLYALILAEPLNEGQRCEVTGCNYYMDTNAVAAVTPPPVWFL